ncbi:DNA fragmentation factor subunit beta [Ceratitis capitata]|uniref:DNA fragmentation factor subunit beta n=1 Tax=Ceratitis capitata TaxID=7213 RepID=UPI00032A3B5A|nr:DNA fragmentation factor subunit beta [Ceratitis capitata]
MLNFFKDVMAPTTRSVKSEDNKDGGICTKMGISGKSAEKSTPTLQMKGYKVTDNERTKKFGIGANTLQMLKDKAKLKFPIKDLRLYMSTDGFEISDDDYFQTLASQTLFIVAGPDEIITTDADFEFEKLCKNSPLLRVADIIYEFIEKNPEQFRKMITDYENRKICRQQALDSNKQSYQSKTQLSLRTQHSEWFAGQEERCHSKEEAMARRAQDRMRSYYYKTKEELTRNKLYRQNLKARHIIDAVLEQFRYLLIGCDYFSMLFDRKCPNKHAILQQQYDDDETDATAMLPNKRLRQVIKEYTARHEILDEWSVSLCTDFGDFYCQGSYSDNGNCCALKHTINPYASRENLILFQVWNLDHQIELSRSILPALIENVRQLVEQPQVKCTLHNKRVIDISVLEYFLEIFSLKNLKLVHIVCHDKTQRANKSNGRLVCEKCHEYKIVQELMGVRDNEDAVDAKS